MDLKKALTLCAALLLVVGFSSDLIAQTAQPQSVRIRISSPADDTWAAIDDTVVVYVESLPGTSTLDSVQIAISADTSLANYGIPNSDAPTDTLVSSWMTTADTTIASYQRFIAQFPILPGGPEGAAKTLVAQAKVKKQGATVMRRINNQSTLESVTGLPTFELVGDAKKIGVDGKRPAAALSSAEIDTTGSGAAAWIGSGTEQMGYKIGNVLKVQVTGTNFPPGGEAVVYVVSQDSVGSANVSTLAKQTFTFSFSDLITGTARDSVTVAQGTFGKVDNQRVLLSANVQDQAGNLGHPTNAASATPQGITSSTVHVIDDDAPKATVHYPNPDSGWTRFTAATTLSDTLVALATGTATTTSIGLKPAELEVDESITSLIATFNSVNDTLALITTKTKLATSFGVTDIAGKKSDLVVAVQDSVGNASSTTVENVTQDAVAPGLISVFPNSGDLPVNDSLPTINSNTRHPVVVFNEDLDSLSVQYVETNATTAHSAKSGLTLGHVDLLKDSSEVTITMVDTLVDGKRYTLQVFLRDLAGNVSVSTADTMTYTKGFVNPIAKTFTVAAANDRVIAGQSNAVTVTAVDTTGTDRTAVTFRSAVRVRVVPLDTSNTTALKSVSYEDDEKLITDNKDGSATLQGAAFTVGVAKFRFRSTMRIPEFKVVVEDVTTTDGVDDVNFNGLSDTLAVDAAEMSMFAVTVMEGGVETSEVSEEFSVAVRPTDMYGNPSTKIRKGDGLTTYAMTDSTALNDSTIADANVLQEMFVNFSANLGDAQVPQGVQALSAGGNTFTAVAPDRNSSESGESLVISVRMANIGADTSGTKNSQDKHYRSMGQSLPLSFVAFGEEPTTGVGAPAAPANLVVEDYPGDQGGFVVMSFPISADHGSVARYRIYREMEVTTSLDEETGEVVRGDAVKTWVPWTAIGAFPVSDEDPVVRAVVPTLDAEPDVWAVAAERGGASSDQVAAKRVFTKESVSQMVQLLGVDPNRVLSTDELEKVFTAPKDYVASILGDRKGHVFAALDPDLGTLLGSAVVPEGIRTAGGGISSSAKTTTEAAVGAVDNIAPAAVTEAGGSVSSGTVTLTWVPSADDKVVAYSSYRGFAIPIAGVEKYEVWRGTTEDNLGKIKTLEAGVATFEDSDLPTGNTLIYRVDALDTNPANTAMSELVPVTLVAGRQKFVGADGKPVYIITPNDTKPLQVDFQDFVGFAQAFGKKEGDAGFSFQADTDDDGDVDFEDFVAFAQSFGKTAVGPATKPVIIETPPGVNGNAELSLSLTSDRVIVGKTVSVDVSLANLEALQAFGFVLNYDADKFEFVEAAPAENDLLKTSGGETPIFFKQTESGQVTIANAVVDGEAVSGQGSVVTLTFKVLREFEDKARFEVADGIVFDSEQFANAVVVLGALSVESTPTEFALLQNFPNPFNPETTIKYNLAEASDVHLRIFNIVGQVVRTLVAERQSAGRYQVRWSGTDDRGVSVSSGIYFYELSAGGKFQDVKRLMLLK